MPQMTGKNPSAEKDWRLTHDRTTENLVSVGGLFGDDEALMRAKADCVYALLRKIVEEIPEVQVATPMPTGLSAQQMAAVREAIRVAARKGIEASMTHSVQALMSSVFDLCTSKLRMRSN